MRRADAVRYVDVVLDDDPAVGSRPDARAGAPAPRAPWWPRRSRVVWVTAAAVLAAVMSASAVDAVAERRDAETLQPYADVPGVVASLRHPVQERWRLPPSGAADVVGDLVVTVDREAVVARDAVSGRTRWSSPIPQDIAGTDVRCPYPGADTEDGAVTVMCLVSPTLGGEPSRWAFGVLDASSGRLVQQEVRPGALLNAAEVDGDLVAAAVVDGDLMVSRHDTVRGRERWSTRLPDISVRDPRLAIRVTSQVVAVEGVMGVVLDARDGREIDSWRPIGRPIQGMSVRVLPRPGEGFGVWTAAFRGRWYRADGQPLAELTGFPADPPVVDRSTPGIVLLGSDDGRRLRAVDVTTGDLRWQRSMPDRVLLRLGGRLAVTDDGTLQGVDMGTGRQLWSVQLAEGDEPGLGPPVTDGLRVLVRGRDETGRPRLTAYALDSGDVVWQAPLAGDGQSLAVLGDRLLSADRRTEQGPAGVLRFLG